jgi:hypothetical protein
MNDSPQITTVDLDHVDRTGFFCYMSKKKEPGYKRKMQWVKERLIEGLRIKMILPPDGRGFIEYIPGEFSWRAVNAPGYMVIHCLWIVGKTRGMGHASLLMDQCIQDARKNGMHGVAMVATSGTWLVHSDFLARTGFKSIAKGPPSFELMVLPFDDSPMPEFCGDWEVKIGKCGPGLTLFRSDQCPYVENEVKYFQKVAAEAGIISKVIELHNAEEVRRLSPSPYGIFNAVLDGKFLTYHFLERDKLLEELRSGRG